MSFTEQETISSDVTKSDVRGKFSWDGVSFSGICWSFAFGVRCLWRHNFTPYSCFQTNVSAKFVDILCIFFYMYSPWFMCHCSEYKLSALQVKISEENKLNATTQQFITAEIPGCALKQWSKHTHRCVRAIYNSKMRLRLSLVEYEQGSTKSVTLDTMTHTAVCKIESW